MKMVAVTESRQTCDRRRRLYKRTEWEFYDSCIAFVIGAYGSNIDGGGKAINDSGIFFGQFEILRY